MSVRRNFRSFDLLPISVIATTHADELFRQAAHNSVAIHARRYCHYLRPFAAEGLAFLR